MPITLLDTSVFILPFTEDLEQLELALLAFVDWHALIACESETVFLSGSCFEALESLHGFPIWKDVQEKLDRAGCTVSVRDVIAVYNGLTKLPTLEDYAGVNDILVDQCECNPDLWEDLDPILRDEAQRATSMLILSNRLRAHDDGKSGILTSLPVKGQQTLQVRGAVEVVEFKISYDQPIDIPFQFNEAVFICDDPSTLFRRSALELYVESVDLETLSQSISTYLLENYPEHSIRPWTLNKALFQCLSAQHLLSNTHGGPVLRAFAESILQINLAATHHLREGVGPNTPQRLRGTDGAWRRDIDRDMHLHYWETATGCELAWVTVNHHDYYIPR